MEPSPPAAAYRFGPFAFDGRSFRLTRDGVEVKLEPRALDALVCMLQRPGELVSRQRLIAEAWSGVAVTDNAVTRAVAGLRRALGDDAEHPLFIETVPTRGYRFIGCLEEEAPTDGSGRPGPPKGPRPEVRPPRLAARLSVTTWLALSAVALGITSAVVLATRSAHWSHSAASEPQATRASSLRTLAILPLRNLTGDSSQDYVADGMTQALADRFSVFGSLSVVSVTSSSRYRHSELPATRISQELGADALVEGAVARSGDRVRVSVGLVDAASGRRLWSRSFDSGLADVLALYDEIAVSAAGEAKLLVEAVNAGRRSRRPVDPQAYDDYLRAMAALGNRWMAGGCQDAERWLLSTIERDPGFAPAHAALAWCYTYPDRIGRDISEIGPRARKEVAAALALDDQLALAHAVAGSIKWRIEYDVAGGESELRRALELDSSSGLVLIPSAEILLWRGHVEQGLPLLERATRLDPFSPDRNVQVGFDLYTVGRYEAACERLRRALELDPGYLIARYYLSEIHAVTGRHDEAVAERLAWLDGSLRPDRAAAARRRLAQARLDGGLDGFWREDLALAEEEHARPGTVWRPSNPRLTGSWHMALRYARLGERERAIDALEEAYRGRHHMMATLPVQPLFTMLRSNDRFKTLLRTTAALPPSL